MLLFNRKWDRAMTQTLLFQYILCYYSTKLLNKTIKQNLKFQYILCYYSTTLQEFDFFYNIPFQYILCYYSTHYLLCLWVIPFISIHPMLLFNMEGALWSLPDLHFNTSHVIIQPTKNRHSCILLIYINHDFKPFLQHFTNHFIENQIFVRNHVFTPFDRLFQKITW